MGVVIREASIDDTAPLREYATRLFAEKLPGLYMRPIPTMDEEREFVRSYCDRQNSTLMVAESDGVIVGLAGLLGRDLPQEEHVGSLGISVDRDCRGNGIGSQLIAALFDWAPTHGIRRIEVEAFANNPDAISLYERLGFEREGLRRGAVVVENESVDVVMLSKLLVV